MKIDGREIAKNILKEVKLEVSKLKFSPVFCDVLVGNDLVQTQYVKMKALAAMRVGIKFRPANFNANITTDELILEVQKISKELNMSGVIVQLPLPNHIDTQAVLNAIDARVDVDCIGQTNTDLFYSGKKFLQYPTAEAVINILDSLNLDLSKKSFLVCGRGQLVGRPVKFLLEEQGYYCQVLHSQTKNPNALLKQADVIISAVGKTNFITGQLIKPGAIIIDAGTSELNGGVAGDVDLNSVLPVASMVSPVPGGVGPVTVAILLRNVLKVAKNK